MSTKDNHTSSLKAPRKEKSAGIRGKSPATTAVTSARSALKVQVVSPRTKHTHHLSPMEPGSYAPSTRKSSADNKVSRTNRVKKDVMNETSDHKKSNTTSTKQFNMSTVESMIQDAMQSVENKVRADYDIRIKTLERALAMKQEEVDVMHVNITSPRSAFTSPRNRTVSAIEAGVLSDEAVLFKIKSDIAEVVNRFKKEVRSTLSNNDALNRKKYTMLSDSFNSLNDAVTKHCDQFVRLNELSTLLTEANRKGLSGGKEDEVKEKRIKERNGQLLVDNISFDVIDKSYVKSPRKYKSNHNRSNSNSSKVNSPKIEQQPKKAVIKLVYNDNDTKSSSSSTTSVPDDIIVRPRKQVVLKSKHKACDECKKIIASITCDECEMGLCRGCDKKLHEMNHYQKHIRTVDNTSKKLITSPNGKVSVILSTASDKTATKPVTSTNKSKRASPKKTQTSTQMKQSSVPDTAVNNKIKSKPAPPTTKRSPKPVSQIKTTTTTSNNNNNIQTKESKKDDNNITLQSGEHTKKVKSVQINDEKKKEKRKSLPIHEEIEEKNNNNHIRKKKTLSPKRSSLKDHLIDNPVGELLPPDRILKTGDLYSFTLSDFHPKPSSNFIGNVQQIAMGLTHGGVITSIGLLYMFGNNRDHQLGNGDNVEPLEYEEAALININNGDKPRQLSCATHHSILCTEEGNVYTWGMGLMGVLGHGSDNDEYTPKLLTTISELEDKKNKAVYVASGPYNSGVIIQSSNNEIVNSVYIWGANEMGQLGNNTYNPQLIPTWIDFKINIIKLDFGHRHSCGLSSTGIVFTWGDNSFGQLGYKLDDDDDNNCNRPAPVTKLQVFNQHIKDIYCGQNHVTVLTTEGKVWSWGSGESHQIGVFDNIDQLLPIEIKSLSHIVSISVGESITAAVSYNGDVYMWGYILETPVPKLMNELKTCFIQDIALGTSEYMIIHTISMRDFYLWDAEHENNGPQLDLTLKGKRYNIISKGEFHTCAIDATGTVNVWGENSEGQLGTGNDISFPMPVSINIDNNAIISSLCCGSHHTIAVSNAGNVYTWGQGLMGKLGHGSDSDENKPRIVDALIGKKCIFVEASASNSAIITDKNELYIWGAGGNGQLGRIDSSTIPAMKPIKFTNPLISNNNIHSVALGERHVIITTKDGATFSWGCNNFGQLGYDSDLIVDDNISKSLNLPRRILENKYIIQVSCGNMISLFLSNEGEVYSCGTMETNQLGYEAEQDQLFPKLIPTFKNIKIKQVIAGYLDCVAITDDDHCYTWGFCFNVLPTLLPSFIDGADENESPKVSLVCVGHGVLQIGV